MLEDIEKELQGGGITPNRAADLRVELSGLYSTLSGKLENVLYLKPNVWKTIREMTQSDTRADRHFEGTELGLEEMSCRLRMKRIDKVISALSSLIRVAEGNAKNQF